MSPYRRQASFYDASHPTPLFVPQAHAVFTYSICALFVILFSLTIFAIVRGEVLFAKEKDLWADIMPEGESISRRSTSTRLVLCRLTSSLPRLTPEQKRLTDNAASFGTDTVSTLDIVHLGGRKLSVDGFSEVDLEKGERRPYAVSCVSSLFWASN